MLPRRLATITQTPESSRFSVLAEGMALLAENVATLEADATTLSAARRDRGAAVLRSFAEEEAAKVLIMFDLARAGWKDDDTISSCLRAFYTHISRGLYGRAYDGSPADFAEVRRYVDVLRQEYYLDGPMDVDWIFGNEVVTNREERLYVDYIEDEDGTRRWTGPADRAAIFDEPFRFPMISPTVVRLIAAMRHIGLLTTEGLSATRAVWDGVVVSDTMHWSELRTVNIAVVEHLATVTGREYATKEDRVALAYVVDHWIFPLSSLDLTISRVKLDDLKREREQRRIAGRACTPC